MRKCAEKNCHEYNITAVNRDDQNVRLKIIQIAVPNHQNQTRNRRQFRGEERAQVCSEGASNLFYESISSSNDINSVVSKSLDI